MVDILNSSQELISKDDYYDFNEFIDKNFYLKNEFSDECRLEIDNFFNDSNYDEYKKNILDFNINTYQEKENKKFEPDFEKICPNTCREKEISNNILSDDTNNSKKNKQTSQKIFNSTYITIDFDEEDNNNFENQKENLNFINEHDNNIVNNYNIFNNNVNNLNLSENQKSSKNSFDIISNELDTFNINNNEKFNINNENNNITNNNICKFNNNNQISKKKGRKKKGDLKEGKIHDKSENGNIKKKIINKIYKCIIKYFNEIIKNEFGQIRKFRKINSKFMKKISTKQKIKEFLDLKIKDFLNNNITAKFKNKSNNKNEETLKFFLENKKEKYKNNQKLNYYLEMEIKTFYKEIFLNLEYKNFIKLEECKLNEKNENNPKYIDKLKKMTENFIEDNYYLSKRKNNSLFITNNDK
jgi:hypothetical protein